MIDDPAYWQAVAQSIDAEDAKASLFIAHNLTVGTAREAILRSFLREHTLEPYRVNTGFIHRPAAGPNDARWCSKQCDIVAHDPTTSRPDYQIDDVVVVNRWALRVIAEVKTDLDSKALGEVLGIWNDVSWLGRPVFAFAYDGLLFDTFLDRITQEIRDAPQGVPHCIAVHRRNYLFVRSGYRLLPPEGSQRHRAASHHYVVDFGQGDARRGLATGAMMRFYLEGFGTVWPDQVVWKWASGLDPATVTRVTLADNGEVV